MSSTYNGALLTIASTTNATPVVVTTTVAHGHTSGDILLITGTSGLIDGGWTITVISATTFSLNSSTAPGGTASSGSIFFYPTAFTIPGDGDAFNAAAFNPAYEALGDRIRMVANRVWLPQVMTVTATGTVTFPANVVGSALLIGCGGGGGGGVGSGGSNTTTNIPCGGGGGGGARLGRATFTPQASHSYTATIGAGGVGQGGVVAGSNGISGGDGGDTTFVDTTTSVTIATFLGAMGGTGGALSNYGTTLSPRYPGGRSVRSLISTGWKSVVRLPFAGASSLFGPVAVGDAFGGDGMSQIEFTNGGFLNGGQQNPDGNFTPGAAGINGTQSGSYYGGGAGGGGGAGPFGSVPASTQAGGAGQSAGTGGAATGIIGATPANSGAGGNGGAAGGNGSSNGGPSTSSAAGGSGQIIIYYYVLPIGAS